METDGEPGGRPTPQEAGAALREIEQAQASLAGTPPPWWYFLALAALVAIAPVVNVAPPTLLGITLTLVGVVAWTALLGIAIGLYVRKVGIVPRVSAVPRRVVWLPMVGVLALLIGAAVLVNVYDQEWIWFVASGVLAALIVVMGGVLRRKARKMA
ncbi:hypothetical protein ABZ863_28595 [Saccharomonospora sp. NPDC046836]|uniref:hypothetical protein n=1 Tax=Saccharomonospora sp. NPDC046836 TaxID=3156921 RepID=UPI0033FB647A